MKVYHFEIIIQIIFLLTVCIFVALCNNARCVNFATCVDGVCICSNGYHGNGYILCEGKNKV